MTRAQAIRTKFNGAPEDINQAIASVRGKKCPVCKSKLLGVIKRHEYTAHCNHCGSQYLVFVLLNQEAWKVTAKI